MEEIKTWLNQMPFSRDGLSLIGHWRMRRYFDRIGLTDLEQQTRNLLPLSVRKGPFAGMKLLSWACGSVWIPKILGCYEVELEFTIEEIVRAEPDVIVDVGCAEGYFAVGFAMRAAARVIAADTNPVARRMVHKLAQMNGVRDRVITTGWITRQKLEHLLAGAGKPVVWCDIEGGEWELLDPNKVPSLRKAWILIEDHEHATGMPLSGFVDRFSHTHNHRLIAQSGRRAMEWMPGELISSLTERDMDLAISELRPPDQKWLFFKPKDG